MKKILLIVSAIVLLIVAYLVATGHFSMSGLKSSALDTDTCNPAYIREKAEAYHQAAFDRQEELTQIVAIKAELVKLEAQKVAASEADSETILADIVAQETALEMLEELEEDELIAEYEACRQDLLFKGLISAEAQITSGEVVAMVSGEMQATSN